MTAARPRLEDLSIIVSGQGGDGSLTVINILADVLRSIGFGAYTERDVLSRIKGGIVTATLRASKEEHLAIGSQIDLIVVFDSAAILKNAHRLNDRSIVVYDSSGGDLPTNSGVPEGARVIGIPFSRHAIRAFFRIFTRTVFHLQSLAV